MLIGLPVPIPNYLLIADQPTKTVVAETSSSESVLDVVSECHQSWKSIFFCDDVPLSPLFSWSWFSAEKCFPRLLTFWMSLSVTTRMWMSPQYLDSTNLGSLSPLILSPVTAHDDDNEALLVNRQNHNVTTGQDIKIWPQTLDSHFGPKIRARWHYQCHYFHSRWVDSYVKLDFKASLFSCIFLFEAIFLGKSALLVLDVFTLWKRDKNMPK